jgi:hypothetical protein
MAIYGREFEPPLSIIPRCATPFDLDQQRSVALIAHAWRGQGYFTASIFVTG